MVLNDFQKISLPGAPGVYFFCDHSGNFLYIGRATNLKTRVRSYFDKELSAKRGKHIVDMVEKSDEIQYVQTDTVFDAILLEAALIKKHTPYYNTREKDNKSFAYICITREDFPHVVIIRQRNMVAVSGRQDSTYLAIFGPFTSVRTAEQILHILRKMIPYSDTCYPGSQKPCFSRQVGLCPGVCTGEISKKAYAQEIQKLRLILSGQKIALKEKTKRHMERAAKALRFEDAARHKKLLFALTHIQDIALVGEEIKAESFRSAQKRLRAHRIEAYDIAHLFGTHTVGVMTVVIDGSIEKSEYRKFKIREQADERLINDHFRTEEVLRRRFAHLQWQYPDVIVIDGGLAHIRAARRVLRELHIRIPVVSVVKNKKHQAKGIIGNIEIAESYKPQILLANMEAHRFALAYHRQLRDRITGATMST